MRIADQPGAGVFTKTITESDVNLFAGITGDLNPVHIDTVYAAEAGFGGRIAHGVFLLGLMSTACTLYAQRAGLRILSYGWERVRFIELVRIGDTITAAYLPSDQPAVPAGNGWKQTAAAEAHNQNGQLVGVGRHLLYLLDEPADS